VEDNKGVKIPLMLIWGDGTPLNIRRRFVSLLLCERRLDIGSRFWLGWHAQDPEGQQNTQAKEASKIENLISRWPFHIARCSVKCSMGGFPEVVDRCYYSTIDVGEHG
jgi:hypothetical protein